MREWGPNEDVWWAEERRNRDRRLRVPRWLYETLWWTLMVAGIIAWVVIIWR